jgi:hypothetical protein
MKNDRFEQDIVLVPEVFDKLNIVDRGGEKFLHGQLDIIDKSGVQWDTYSVEIKASNEYPFRFPKLFEIGNAFNKIADWHVYEDDGSCCVDVTPNEIILCQNELNVLDYIRDFAIPYLANQTFRKREGYYLHGEYAHGILGRLEFYQSKLKAKDIAELIYMFQLILIDFDLPRTGFCPICKNIKFRNCHQRSFRELRNVKSMIDYDGVQLLQYVFRNPNFKLPN